MVSFYNLWNILYSVVETYLVFVLNLVLGSQNKNTDYSLNETNIKWVSLSKDTEEDGWGWVDNVA